MNHKHLVVSLTLILIALLVLSGVIYLGNRSRATESEVQLQTEGEGVSIITLERASYFLNTLVAEVELQKGKKDGYTPSDILEVYPGFVPEDFAGVEALGGTYSVEGDTPLFAPFTQEEVTGAGTLTQNGYFTLLQNSVNRLGFTITDSISVDRLLRVLKQ